MTTSAVALEETEAFAMPGDKLRELCEQDREFGYRFTERLAGALARRLVATRLQLLDLFASETPRSPAEQSHG
jgi:CRP-like cAMP-binding protein